MAAFGSIVGGSPQSPLLHEVVVGANSGARGQQQQQYVPAHQNRGRSRGGVGPSIGSAFPRVGSVMSEISEIGILPTISRGPSPSHFNNQSAEFNNLRFSMAGNNYGGGDVTLGSASNIANLLAARHAHVAASCLEDGADDDDDSHIAVMACQRRRGGEEGKGKMGAEGVGDSASPSSSSLSSSVVSPLVAARENPLDEGRGEAVPPSQSHQKARGQPNGMTLRSVPRHRRRSDNDDDDDDDDGSATADSKHKHERRVPEAGVPDARSAHIGGINSVGGGVEAFDASLARQVLPTFSVRLRPRSGDDGSSSTGGAGGYGGLQHPPPPPVAALSVGGGESMFGSGGVARFITNNAELHQRPLDESLSTGAVGLVFGAHVPMPPKSPHHSSSSPQHNQRQSPRPQSAADDDAGSSRRSSVVSFCALGGGGLEDGEEKEKGDDDDDGLEGALPAAAAAAPRRSRSKELAVAAPALLGVPLRAGEHAVGKRAAASFASPLTLLSSKLCRINSRQASDEEEATPRLPSHPRLHATSIATQQAAAAAVAATTTTAPTAAAVLSASSSKSPAGGGAEGSVLVSPSNFVSIAASCLASSSSPLTPRIGDAKEEGQKKVKVKEREGEGGEAGGADNGGLHSSRLPEWSTAIGSSGRGRGIQHSNLGRHPSVDEFYAVASPIHHHTYCGSAVDTGGRGEALRSAPVSPQLESRLRSDQSPFRLQEGSAGSHGGEQQGEEGKGGDGILLTTDDGTQHTKHGDENDDAIIGGGGGGLPTERGGGEGRERGRGASYSNDDGDIASPPPKMPPTAAVEGSEAAHHQPPHNQNHLLRGSSSQQKRVPVRVLNRHHSTASLSAAAGMGGSSFHNTPANTPRASVGGGGGGGGGPASVAVASGNFAFGSSSFSPRHLSSSPHQSMRCFPAPPSPPLRSPRRRPRLPAAERASARGCSSGLSILWPPPAAPALAAMLVWGRSLLEPAWPPLDLLLVAALSRLSFTK